MTLLRDRRGASAVEFALVAPALLMFIFLILDCGRMLFIKQVLNQAAVTTARCRALGATGCDTDTNAGTWGSTQALRLGGPMLTGVTAVAVGTATALQCNGRTDMSQATVSLTYKRGAMNLLPQSLSPSTISSKYCFPKPS